MPERDAPATSRGSRLSLFFPVGRENLLGRASDFRNRSPAPACYAGYDTGEKRRATVVGSPIRIEGLRLLHIYCGTGQFVKKSHGVGLPFLLSSSRVFAIAFVADCPQRTRELSVRLYSLKTLLVRSESHLHTHGSSVRVPLNYLATSRSY